MKKHLALLMAFAALWATNAEAQKLSPKAELLLAKKNTPESLRVPAHAAEVAQESVKVFVKINDDDAVKEMEQLGAKVFNVFPGGIVTAQVPVSALERVAQLGEVNYVDLGASVNMLMDTARVNSNVDEIHSNIHGELPSAFTGKGVVVGVIDNGLEYNHPAFYTSDGTECRLRAVWDQAAMGKAPSKFGYGAEYLTQAEFIAGYTDSYATYHGSHTTGIAAGGDKRSKYYGVAPDADIVYVSYASSSVDIANGIQYIFDYADRVGKPCVINMSLGSHEGPHTGDSFLDQVIDSSVGEGRIVVGACGNEAISNMHVSKSFTDDDTSLKTLLTPMQGSQYGKRHIIEAWGTKGSNFTAKVVVVDALKGRIVSETEVYRTANDRQPTIIKSFYLDDHGANATIYIKGVNNPENGFPSAEMDISVSTLGSGRMIGVVIEGEPGADVNLWNLVQNNFTSNNLSGWTNGDNESTVGEIGGTAKRIITVGSYDSRYTVFWNDNTYSISQGIDYLDHSYFSSLGPTADGRTVPHILAPGSPVIAPASKYGFTLGSLADYTSEITHGYNDENERFYYAYNQGTSMASPFVAGTIALLLEANPELTPEEAREAIMSTANTDDFMGELPNNTYGAGRLNAYESLKRVLGITTSTSSIQSDEGATLKAWVESGSSAVCLASSRPEGETVKIYDIAGRCLTSINVGSLATFDASAWGHGVFVVKSETTTLKLAL